MKIGVCLTTYNPDLELLTQVVESLINQVDCIYISDNGSQNVDEIVSLVGSVTIVNKLGKNTGIGNSTNVALGYFTEQGFDYALLSDQDTIYAADYVKKFVEAKKEISFDNVAAYAPVYFDKIQNFYPPLVVKSKTYIKKVPCENKYTPVFQAIASGLILDVSKLEKIGLMDANLFIDWVDLEWCWRCNYLGYKIVACKNMVMNHNLGEFTKKLGKKSITMRSTTRQYYIVRNCMYLACHCHVLSFTHKLVLFYKAFCYYFGYLKLDKQEGRKDSRRIYSKALKDGVKANLGEMK